MSDNVVDLRPNQDTPTRDERDWITSLELCADTGITYRQLDYWTRTGLLHTITAPDPGSGYMRVYPESQIDRATAIKQLLDAGVVLQMIRAHIDEFVTHGRLDVGPITIARNPGAAS